jgi:hypothetical protein
MTPHACPLQRWTADVLRALDAVQLAAELDRLERCACWATRARREVACLQAACVRAELARRSAAGAEHAARPAR